MPQYRMKQLLPRAADLIAAMQASPYKEIDLESVRNRLPVRDVVF